MISLLIFAVVVLFCAAVVVGVMRSRRRHIRNSLCVARSARGWDFH